MNHSDFFKMIRHGLSGGTFVLHGEEEYVKAQAVKMIESRYDEDLRPFNVTVLNKPAPQELTESCEMLPLFADTRTVICYELADGTDASKYMQAFDEHPEETVLILVFKGKLAANSAVLKYAKKHDSEVLFEKLSASERAKWCMKHMNEAGVHLPQDTALMLVQMLGDDMANTVSETDKLIDLVSPGAVVTPQDIALCIRPAVDVRIFDMLDMFTYGKPGDGVKALHALFDEGNDPMSVSGFLISRFKLMLEARRLIDAGRSKRDAAAAMEGNRFANEKAYDAAKRFTRAELMELISALSDTGYMKISGAMKDDKYLELVLLKHEWRQNPV